MSGRTGIRAAPVHGITWKIVSIASFQRDESTAAAANAASIAGKFQETLIRDIRF
jgi:hypothetical protein